MTPKWLRWLLDPGEGKSVNLDDTSIQSKTNGLENMKRINEAILSGSCEPHQLEALELGAETITLNLKKNDTDRTKKEKRA